MISLNNFKKSFTAFVLILTLAFVGIATNSQIAIADPATTPETATAAEVFSANCAGCHINGGAYKNRLSEQQIIDVSAYVLSQAETDWK